MRFKNLVPMRWNSHAEPNIYNHEFPLFSINSQMDRFFDHLNINFFETPQFDFHPTFKQNYIPKVDFIETENGFRISAELPGMDDKDVDVTLDDGVLTLKGEKKIVKEDKHQDYYNVERSYGSFQRSFKVPEIIDQDKIDASFTKGILTIKLPKTPEANKEVKSIPIN